MTNLARHTTPAGFCANRSSVVSQFVAPSRSLVLGRGSPLLANPTVRGIQAADAIPVPAEAEGT